MQIDLSMQSASIACNCHTIATENLSRLVHGANLYNQSAIVGSVHKRSEKEEANDGKRPPNAAARA
jgi:hypothetical protein